MSNSIPSLTIKINVRIIDPVKKTNVNKTSQPNKFQYANQENKLPHAAQQTPFIKRDLLANKRFSLTKTMESVLNFIKRCGKKLSRSNDTSTPKLNKYANYIIRNENYRPHSDETTPKKIDNEVDVQKHTKTNSNPAGATNQHLNDTTTNNVSINDTTTNNVSIKDNATSTIDKKQNEIKDLDQQINKKIEQTNQLDAEIGSKNIETNNLSANIEHQKLTTEELKSNIAAHRAKQEELNIKLENKILQLKKLDSMIMEHFNINHERYITDFWLDDNRNIQDFESVLDIYKPEYLYSQVSKHKPLESNFTENQDLDSEPEYAEIAQK